MDATSEVAMNHDCDIHRPVDLLSIIASAEISRNKMSLMRWCRMCRLLLNSIDFTRHFSGTAFRGSLFPVERGLRLPD